MESDVCGTGTDDYDGFKKVVGELSGDEEASSNSLLKRLQELETSLDQTIALLEAVLVHTDKVKAEWSAHDVPTGTGIFR